MTRAKKLLTHQGLHYVLLIVFVIVFACAGLEVAFERHVHSSHGIHNFGEALWWAVVTVTTVGYGDRVPETAAGQGVAVVLMLVGIGLVGVLTATIASFFVSEQRDDLRLAVQSVQEQLSRVEAMVSALAAGQSVSGGDAQLPVVGEALPAGDSDLSG